MKIFYLDLEDTIIESYSDPYLIHQSKVKELIDAFNPDEVRLFSFAVQTPKELEHAKKAILPQVERAIGRPFAKTDIRDDILRAVYRKWCFNVQDRDDFLIVNDKGILFQEWVALEQKKLNGVPLTAMLLDDDVETRDIRYPNRQLDIEIRCVYDYVSKPKPRSGMQPLW